MSKYKKILLLLTAFAVSASSYAKLYGIDVNNNTGKSLDVDIGQFNNAVYQTFGTSVPPTELHSFAIVEQPEGQLPSNAFFQVYDSNIARWGCYFGVIASHAGLSNPYAQNMDGNPNGVKCTAQIHGNQILFTIANPSK